MSKTTVIVSYNVDSEANLPQDTKIFRVSTEDQRKVLKWAAQFGELMDDETLDGYRRLWYKTLSGGTTVVEYLTKE